MASISQTYASPGLRWGILLEDFPGAYVEYTESNGTDLGIPAHKGGDEPFVVATIIFPDDSGRSPVAGWKALSSKVSSPEHPSDVWLTLSTKALGRALKRAGYPDDTKDLRALVLWRQRNAEIGAIVDGTAGLALPAAEVDKAIVAAGRGSEDEEGGDDGNAPDTDTLDLDSEEVTHRGDPSVVAPSADQMADLRTAINVLGPRSAELTTWAKKEGIRISRPANVNDWNRLMMRAAEMAAEGVGVPHGSDGAPAAAEPTEGDPGAVPAAPGDNLADGVAAAIGGLDADQMKQFTVFCKSLGIKGVPDPFSLSRSELLELNAWLEVDPDAANAE